MLCVNGLLGVLGHGVKVPFLLNLGTGWKSVVVLFSLVALCPSTVPESSNVGPE
jgi:Zn-dependent membrane protease YugP